MGECPPSDKDVGCEHGTWGHSISVILCEMEVSLHLLDGLGVVFTEEGMYLPRSRAKRFLMTFTAMLSQSTPTNHIHTVTLLVHTRKRHLFSEYSPLPFLTSCI